MAKKKLDRLSVDEKKRLIEVDNKGPSVRRQCELVGLNRSNLYYEPVGVRDENSTVYASGR